LFDQCFIRNSGFYDTVEARIAALIFSENRPGNRVCCLQFLAFDGILLLDNDILEGQVFDLVA